MNLAQKAAAIAALVAFAGAASAAEPVIERTDAYVMKTTGAGPDFFMLPGLTSSMDVWDEAAARYSGRFTVHQLTFAGFAGVPPTDGPFLQTRLDAVLAYAKAHDIHDAVVMGHSIGGFMALKLAKAAPDRFSQVVVVDSPPFLAELFLRAQSAEQAKAGAAQMRDAMMAQSDEAFHAAQRQQLPRFTKSKEKIAVLADWGDTSDKATIASAMYEVLSADLRSGLAEISARGLVVYAWDEAMGVPAEAVDDIYERQYTSYKDVTLKRIDGSYHFIMWDQPDALFTAIDAFLAD